MSTHRRETGDMIYLQLGEMWRDFYVDFFSLVASRLLRVLCVLTEKVAWVISEELKMHFT